MKKHTKIYFDYFGYKPGDFIPCELCGREAVDIHHIEGRGMGGSVIQDTICNLMALCRICHVFYGDKKQHLDYLKTKHNTKL